MSQHDNAFLNALAEVIALKDIPNANVDEFAGDVFTFGDYFDREVYQESSGQELSDEQINDVVDEVYEPYLDLADQSAFVTVSFVKEDNKNWCDMVVEIPDNEDEQQELGTLVGEAIIERRNR